jgi:hypothetical protein
MTTILSDPCLRAHCAFGEICIQNTDRATYSCVNEKSLAVKMKAQPNKDAARILADDNNVNINNQRQRLVINEFGEMEQQPQQQPQQQTIPKNSDDDDEGSIPEFLLNYPKDHSEFTVNLNDPCLSSPCSFGSLCKPINLREYICVNEKTLQRPSSASHHRGHVFAHVNDLFSKLASEKLADNQGLSSSSSFTQLKGELLYFFLQSHKFTGHLLSE